MKSIAHPQPASASASPATAGVLPFDFQPLNRVVFGAGSLSRLGELTLELGGRKVLLVTDPGLEAAGHPQRAQASLQAADLSVFVFDRVEENPTTSHVQDGADFARECDADFIVAIGGGSAMDCAKGINFLVTNGGSMANYMGMGKAEKPMLPSIGIPTTAGTGSEAQSFALIADERTHMKMACGDRKAAFRIALLDPELTVSQPRVVTAVTGIDAIAHALESYVTVRRNSFSQLFAREAWRLLEANFETVLRDPKELTARGAMQLGAYYAGMAIEHSMLGACHACANPLTAHYGLTHGVAIGILLPHVLRFNAPGVGSLYGDLVHGAGLANGTAHIAAETLAKRIEELLCVANLPTRLYDCGISRGILPLLAEEANAQWTARHNPRPVAEPDLVRIYEAAL